MTRDPQSLISWMLETWMNRLLENAPESFRAHMNASNEDALRAVELAQMAEAAARAGDTEGALCLKAEALRALQLARLESDLAKQPEKEKPDA